VNEADSRDQRFDGRGFWEASLERARCPAPDAIR
jgi:hypothetical protein